MRTSLGAIVGLACLVAVVALSTPAAAEPECVPTSGGLDYPSYACVDPSDPKCAVYTLTTTDWGTEKHCYGVLS